MLRKTRVALVCASALAGTVPAWASAPLVTGAVDDSVTVTLKNERPVSLHAASDKGALDDAMVLPHVILAMKRPADRQAALDRLVEDQQDRKSPHFHQWLKASDLRSYGPAEADIDKTVGWLKSHGLTVNRVSPSGMTIDIAGTAKQIGETFHTELHNVSVKGEAHIANMRDPAIPAALAPVLVGPTLSNFFPKPNLVKGKPQDNIPFSPTFYALAPGDFATIYNLKPLFNGTSAFGAPITGKGVTITLVEQTNILPRDWNTFRKAFGLSGYAGTLTLTQPGSCGDPGYIGDEIEAAIDVDWASAAAPDADIVEAACPASATTFGVQTALQNLVELGTTSSIFSISYGGSEIDNGLAFVTSWGNLVEEGAAEGISIFISSGDSGAAGGTGLGVNGLSTNPYNTTVGGTDFYDGATNSFSTYWGANHDHYSSAKSYIPEIPWDNSCASSILYKYYGYKSSIVACNDPALGAHDQNGVGGSGGQSIYFAKPSWQNIGVPGMPADGVRDQPDVSLFAANGIWGHAYIICMSDPRIGGLPCDYQNLNDVNQLLWGGTSVSSPAMAGITALVSQAVGGKLGNTAPVLYQLGKLQFTNSLLLNGCNSTLGTKEAGACIFNNVTIGDNAEPCVKGQTNCFFNKYATNGIGVLSTNPGPHEIDAFPATPGYSLATGLGTVNATNLVLNYYLYIYNP